MEVYLPFCNNILSLCEEVVKTLESDETTCVDLYSKMDNFKQKLTQGQDDRFYGHICFHVMQTRQISLHFSTRHSHMFSEDNRLFSLQPLSLHHGTLTFSDIERVTAKIQTSIKSTWMNFVMNAPQQNPF